MKTWLRYPLLLLFLLPYTASYSDSGGRISVVNGTKRYLHVVMDGAPYLYVGPGGSVSLTTGEGSHMVYAFYSPGQGITASADTVLQIERHETNYLGNACKGNEANTCNCSSTESNNTVSYSSATWTVKPESLAGGDE